MELTPHQRQELQQWSMGLGICPEWLIRHHREQAEKDLARLKREYGLTVRWTRLVKEPFTDGMHHLLAEILTSRREPLTIKWWNRSVSITSGLWHKQSDATGAWTILRRRDLIPEGGWEDA